MLLYLILISLPVLTFLSFYLYHKNVTSKYWLKRKVPHLEPKFVLGNLWRGGLFEHLSEIMKNFHVNNREKKILGYWMFFKPNLLIMDLDILKRVLIRDFNNFRDRGIEVDTDLDPLAGHLFMLSGKKWRNLRVKLTPTFTSGKMKLMFPIMVKNAQELESHLGKSAESKESVDVKDILARFTTDVIASCAFGIETNSLQNPNSEFRQFGKKVFSTNLRNVITNILFALYPPLLKMLKHRMVPKDISDFFINAVRETVDFREKNNTKRNDFLQLLIQLIRAGKIEDADKTPVDEMEDEEIVYKFSLLEAAAQCFVFFVAGFETSSTALTFGLYELALNPDIQSRLQKEIDSSFEKDGNELNYDTMCGMEYLDMVVKETLRKYPPVGILQRKCSNDYHLPELGVTLEKGTQLIVSVTGIHHDPDNYPNPEKFDPERFLEDEKNARDPLTYLPFGEGPRNCIGNRFALMQVKVGFIYALRNYTVHVCKETPIPVVLEPKTFIPVPIGGMYLTFEKR